jgi:predicted Ser/Thr protein kinase
MTLEAGRSLGPYEILGPLGAGGMGEVYKARDSRLERTVAIKVLPAPLTKDPELRARLEREAKALSSLNHPHICALYDIGQQDGVDFLVMEHIEGESLAERLARGALPPEEVVRFGIQIAQALDKAHKHGVVHRDLKPGNVMLTKSGAKLLDFGLARADVPQARDASGNTALPTMERPLTAAGTMLGTFQYMAPEQLEGREADARTDIFALGALLHEMATAQKAFSGPTQASLIAAIMHEQPPSISTLQPMTSPALDRLVRACLAKDPDERVQTAHDVALELKWVAEGGSQVGLPAPVATRRRRRERLAWAGFAVAAGAALALAIGYLGRAPQPLPVVRFQIAAPASSPSTRRAPPARPSSGCARWTHSRRGRYRARRGPAGLSGRPTAASSASSPKASSRRSMSPADHHRRSATRRAAPTPPGAATASSCSTVVPTTPSCACPRAAGSRSPRSRATRRREPPWAGPSSCPTAAIFCTCSTDPRTTTKS